MHLISTEEKLALKHSRNIKTRDTDCIKIALKHSIKSLMSFTFLSFLLIIPNILYSCFFFIAILSYHKLSLFSFFFSISNSGFGLTVFLLLSFTYSFFSHHLPLTVYFWSPFLSFFYFSFHPAIYRSLA